jgi:uncharacterized membrane protein
LKKQDLTKAVLVAIIVVVVLSIISSFFGFGNGMMGGMMMGMMGFGTIIFLAPIFFIAYLFLRNNESEDDHEPGVDKKKTLAVEDLDTRYANGQISRDTYLEIKKDIQHNW